MTQAVYKDATANAGPADGATLYSVTLTGGSDAATLLLRYNGSGGTQLIATIKAPTVTMVHLTFPGGIAYTGQLHGTQTGTAPNWSVTLGI